MKFLQNNHTFFEKPLAQTLTLGSMIIFLIVSVLLVGISYNPNSMKGQYATRLAESFISGNLYFNDLPKLPNGEINNIDISWFGGNPYWPMGPFPSALLVPPILIFNWLNIPFQQILVHYLITGLILFAIFKVAKKLHYSSENAWWFCFAFMFSIFLPLPALTFHLPHLVIVLLLWASIWEYLNHKRPWPLGFLSAFALATRLSAGFVVILFLLDILVTENQNLKQKIKNSAKLLAPVLIIIFILGAYNQARFGSVWESGYKYQSLFPETTMARSYGLINPIHIPGNLYYFLLQPPVPVFKDSISHVLQYPFIKTEWWGMGIFFTSPFLIGLFFLKYRTKQLKHLIITIAAISLPILLYYGIGYKQFGFRYALDFLPLLFFLFMISYHDKYSELSTGIKITMIFSALINWHLLSS